MEDEERWDKVKNWVNVQHDIQTRLQKPDKFDQSVTLYHGPQVVSTISMQAQYIFQRTNCKMKFKV